jgi:hypothetical protein
MARPARGRPSQSEENLFKPAVGGLRPLKKFLSVLGVLCGSICLAFVRGAKS